METLVPRMAERVQGAMLGSSVRRWNPILIVMRLALLIMLALLLMGCSSRPSARLGGDPGGVPVTVVVSYDREALEMITSGGDFQRTVVVDHGGFYGGYHRGYGYPYRHPGRVGSIGGWYSPAHSYEPTTSLSILVGRGPAEAQYLRASLVDGTWDWTLPIAADTEVVVSMQASGGRSGWREIGRFTATAGQTVQVEIAGAEPRVTATSP